MSYWLIIPNHNVHTSNSLQDIRQNHWTMEYRSQWPTLILGSNIRSYWFILPDIHQIVFKILGKITGLWNTGHADLHFMTHKSMSQGLAMSDQLSALVVFIKEKVEKHFLKVSWIFTSSPTPGHGPWGQESWNESRPSRVPMVQIWKLSDERLVRYTPLELV